LLWRQAKRVESTITLTSEHHCPGWKILYKEAKGVKLDRHIVITGQLTNRDQILNNIRGNENVFEVERRS
jgi:hypothetical protein